MKLVIYAHPYDAMARNVLKCFSAAYNGPDPVYLTDLKDVETYLKQPSYQGNLLLLMPKDRKELDALVAIGDLMRDDKLILVLPEDDPDINEQSHLMRPRFVTYSDCAPSQLISVIGRLLEAETAPPLKAARWDGKVLFPLKHSQTTGHGKFCKLT